MMYATMVKERSLAHHIVIIRVEVFPNRISLLILFVALFYLTFSYITQPG